MELEPLVPKKVFFTRGVGTHKDNLTSFELALRDAGIERFNLVTVSSILPPNSEVVSKNKGLAMLNSGEIVFVVMSRNSSNEHNRLIAASVGAAIPADRSQHGYLSEHHSCGESNDATGEYAEDLAASMLASTLGIEFNVDQSWDEKEELFKVSGKIVRTTNITQSAVIDKQGVWTTVLAAAVFVLRDANGQNAPLPQNQQKPTDENNAVQMKVPANAPASPSQESR